MANWSRNSITLAGAGADNVVAFINDHLEPIPHPKTMVYVDIAPMFAETPPHYGGLNLRNEDVPLTLDEKGKTAFWCETKWQPPVEAFLLLTQKYPALKVTIDWSVQLDYVPRAVRIANGQVTFLRDGDFVLAERGEPVHHWLVEATPEAMAAIEAADVKVLRPSSPWSQDGFRKFNELRIRDNQIAKVKSIPGVVCRPFTLDENSFLCGLDPNIYPTGVEYEEAARLVKLCERRQVLLTPQEIETVRKKTLAAMATPDAVGFHAADRFNFYPTGQEITWLLPLSSEERRKELQAALNSPAWATKWSEWEECDVTAVVKEEEPSKP